MSAEPAPSAAKSGVPCAVPSTEAVAAFSSAVRSPASYLSSSWSGAGFRRCAGRDSCPAGVTGSPSQRPNRWNVGVDDSAAGSPIAAPSACQRCAKSRVQVSAPRTSASALRAALWQSSQSAADRWSSAVAGLLRRIIRWPAVSGVRGRVTSQTAEPKSSRLDNCMCIPSAIVFPRPRLSRPRPAFRGAAACRPLNGPDPAASAARVARWEDSWLTSLRCARALTSAGSGLDPPSPTLAAS
ncbi:hypothetical protein D9M72_447750 [compost metagenome]